jgi:peptidoglycan/LPS O-acetylase OafA/YrhL
MVWHFFIIREVIWKNESEWQPPHVSRLMSLTGGWTVYMFFAITAYLFISKLLRTKEAETGYWLKLYISRFFRLIPVCALATILLLFLKPSLFQSLTDLRTLRGLLIMATASLSGGFGHSGSRLNRQFYKCVGWS